MSKTCEAVGCFQFSSAWLCLGLCQLNGMFLFLHGNMLLLEASLVLISASNFLS